MGPSALIVTRLWNLFLRKDKVRFVRFCGENDKITFRDLCGITMVETRKEAGVTANNPSGNNNTAAYIDIQRVVKGTWISELSGFIEMNRGMAQRDPHAMPGLAASALACGSMENSYREVAKVLVSTIDKAGRGKVVRNTDQSLLVLLDETIDNPFFKELMENRQADHDVYRNLPFGSGDPRKVTETETATRQTLAMEALRKWNSMEGTRTNHTVLIGGVNYQFGGATANQKSIGKPKEHKFWSFIGTAGHWAKIVNGEVRPENARFTKDHMKIIRDIILWMLPG